MDLEKSVKDVESDPSPDQVDETPETVEEPEAEVSEETPAEGEDTEKKDRIYNLQREYDRKLEKTVKELREDLRNERKVFQESLKELVSTLQQPSGVAKERTLSDYSLQELQTLRADYASKEGADPATLGQLDDLIVEKRIDARVSEKLESTLGHQKKETTRESAIRSAVTKYPELRDSSSKFFQAVDARLKSLGSSYVDSNPWAVEDAANWVAVNQGYTARQPRTPVREPVRGSKPDPDVSKGDEELEKDLKKIGDIFVHKGVVDPKKLTPERLKELKETQEAYNKHFRRA